MHITLNNTKKQSYYDAHAVYMAYSLCCGIKVSLLVIQFITNISKGFLQ